MSTPSKNHASGGGGRGGPTAWAALRAHWPEYLIEAWALGMFMVSAGLFTTLFEFPGSPVHQAIDDPRLRRALIGLAMGFTAIALIYSPWGQRSGAHMNPSVTLAFLRLGCIRGWDAALYIVAQFTGGVLGVLLVLALLGTAFAAPPVSHAVTVPGPGGLWMAFAAEFAISALMMLAVLTVSGHPRYAGRTGLVAGLLVALFITFEAPLSGMSMNPARSFGSALPGGTWNSYWIYLVAPVAGMQLGALAFVLRVGGDRVPCAKLVHGTAQRCIHCGYEPPPAPGTAKT